MGGTGNVDIVSGLQINQGTKIVKWKERSW